MSAARRWLALDLFRGFAVISMIQGHTFTALLQPREYDGAWSTWHTLLHGLTAPMFLFGGGLAFGLVSRKAAENGGDKSGRISRRALLLIAIGYGLQLPSFTKPLSTAAVARALQVGPLQLIGACLLLAEALRRSSAGRRVSRSCSHTDARASMLALGTATVIAFSAPLVWRMRTSSSLPLALGTWLDGYRGSYFPFFPWAAFFFCGWGLVPISDSLRAPSSRRSAALWLTAGGLAIAAGTYGLFLKGWLLRSLYGEHELWHTSPLYFAFRLGSVIAFLGLLAGSERLTSALWPKLKPLSPWFDLLSRSSLLAYVAHLLMLYGTPFTRGLATLGQTLTKIEASLTFAGVLLATLLVVSGTQRAKISLRSASLRSSRAEPVVSQIHGVRERERRDAAAAE